MKDLVRMRARKALRYANRRLSAGDYFEAKPGHANLLARLHRAVPVTRESLPPPAEDVAAEALPAAGSAEAAEPAPGLALAHAPAHAPARHPLDHDGDGRPGGSAKPAEDERLAGLRAEYRDMFGKRPGNGWDADELQRRMEEERQRRAAEAE